MWYLKNKLDDVDIYKPSVFNKLRLPRLSIRRPDVIQTIKDIEKDFDTILQLEAQVLANTATAEQDDLVDHLNEHNAQVDDIAYNIDKQIYRLLNLAEEQITTIEENLRLSEIYLPK